MPGAREKDIFDGENDNFENPLSAKVANGSETATPSAEDGASAAEMIAANDAEMTEDELVDLTYAFQAADMDGGGAIDCDEFAMMLAVMGCEISMDQVKQVIGDAKDGFGAWKKMADKENIEKCQRIWDEYDADGSGTMDLKEVNAVISNLQEMGFSPEPMSAADLADGELDFDEFSAWFLKQEGLPDEFGPPGGGTLNPAAIKEKGKVGAAMGKAFKPFTAATKKAVAGPQALLQASAKMVKKGDGELPVDPETGEVDEDAKMAALMEDRNELIFAEYVFMMRAGSLKAFLPGDWQERAEDMRKLREAFDAADVDGDNQLELEELEMCIVSMNPKAEVSMKDIARVWRVLNPENKLEINYGEFVQGMIKVKRDPILSTVVPMDVPNRFMLLSLLIDTPINEEQEALIMAKLEGAEKMGIGILEKLAKPPLTREEIKSVLAMACNGKLHFLTDEQRSAVNSIHWWCVAQAALIALVWTGLPGVWENFMVYTFDTDGAVDAYWMCPETIGDPNAAPWGVGNLTLQVCPYGKCTSIPEMNASEYLALGGNTAMGGNWTDGDYLTDKDCTNLLGSSSYDTGLDRLMKWWGLNVIGIVVGIIFEIGLLIFTALRSAAKVTAAIDMRLTPVNEDRAKVAGMVIRSVFELPDPEDSDLGVDASAEAGSGRSPIWDIVAVILVKAKVILTGVVFKQITARLVSYDTATWLKPYSGTMLACIIWDSMMCHAIMRRVEIRALGVTTAVEVFNDIFDTFCPMYEADPDSLSEIARVQVLRSIGVAIVKAGTMFPTMELLLRHAINYLNMKKNKAIKTGGIIDNEEAFIEDFDKITLDESRAVMCIHMLCYVLDGSIGFTEMSLWQKCCERVEELYADDKQKFDKFTVPELRHWLMKRQPLLKIAIERIPIDDAALEKKELDYLVKTVPRPENAAVFDSLTPRVICQQFRYNTPVTTQMLMSCFDPDMNQKFRATSLTPNQIFAFTFNEFTYKVLAILTKQV